jgi:hypothetical protein
VNGREHPCSLEEYLAIRAVSSGDVNLWLASPSVYDARDRGEVESEDATWAMNRGIGVHALVLEGADVYASRIAVWRGGVTLKGAPTTSRNSASYATWKASLGGRVEVSEKDDDKVRRMCAALQSHDEARSLLWGESGEPEVTLLWDDDATGLPCKARIDRLLRHKGWPVELKSTCDVRPEALQRKAYADHWHRRQAFYSEGYRQVFGHNPQSAKATTTFAVPSTASLPCGSRGYGELRGKRE